jgi:hypothetical protein
VRRTASIVVFIVLAVAVPASAQAAPALRVGKHHHAHRIHDRLLPQPARTALPAVPVGTRVVLGAVRARAAALPPADAKRYNDALSQARAARDRLPAGTPRTELAAVIGTVEGIQSRGGLVPSRVNALVLTLQRNTQFWPANTAPAAGTRVQFTGSPVYFEYYPGQGLQIQPLASFGKANAAWSSCRSKGDATCTTLRSLLDAMISLAAQRGTFSAWSTTSRSRAACHRG